MKYIGLVIDDWNYENEDKAFIYVLLVEAQSKAIPSKLRKSLNVDSQR